MSSFIITIKGGEISNLPEYTQSVEKLNMGNIDSIQDENWETLSDTLSTPKAYTRSIIINDSIYIIGGMEEDQYSKTIEMISTTDNSCNIDSSMDYALHSVAVSVTNDSVYIMGMPSMPLSSDHNML